jgi:hypothetical protein
MTLANLASSGGADTVVFASCDAVQLAPENLGMILPPSMAA